jgi:transcriptional regulator with XRE-family HTH domain
MKRVLEYGTRQQLSEFLKTRRARLSPTDVGLPRGIGRRIQGLRREEVAALAGVGLTWYTWLEQGRDIQVSTSFLENLARTLKLSPAERAHLFALAQHRAPPRPIADSSSSASERLQVILDAIDSPAYARNDRFDVVAWNGANTLMFGDFASVAPEQRNVLRLMFTRHSYRHTIKNWEEDARGLIAKFRLNFGQAVGAAAFSTLISELSAISPDFQRMWAEHDVSDLGEGVTCFSSPRHGATVFQHFTMMPEALPDLRIVVFIPVLGS